MCTYNTLLDAINGLKKEGYTEDFNLKHEWIEYSKGNFNVLHNEFVIDKHYRFDDDSDPSNQSIIYAISSDKYKLKGVLVNAYGIYSETTTNILLDKLNKL